jgi:peptidoglycan/xylan/chitin deacetylase (PgdA/CDA1 family)
MQPGDAQIREDLPSRDVASYTSGMLAVMEDLWRGNSPAGFWRLMSDKTPDSERWTGAIQKASDVLPIAARVDGTGIDALLARTLGEGQFGQGHWRLSLTKQLYYALKPALPASLRRLLRLLHAPVARAGFPLQWPIERRYVQFESDVMRELLLASNEAEVEFVHFWPWGLRFAFVLTHDIESAEGQNQVRRVADLEEGLGFRSSFNFVPEAYSVEQDLLGELRQRGFEIGIHGLNHDGKLFRSEAEFIERARRINRYLAEFGAVGFRAPLTHRRPDWMQALEIEYDLSYFDTDPYEPVPGGTMSIWPFFLGRFVELPYTLAQDYTLTEILRERSARLWLEKLSFIEDHCGLALVNTHPDYLKVDHTWRVYTEFLEELKGRSNYWHALPREVARWWRARARVPRPEALIGAALGKVCLAGSDLSIEVEVNTREGKGKALVAQGGTGR